MKAKRDVQNISSLNILIEYYSIRTDSRAVNRCSSTVLDGNIFAPSIYQKGVQSQFRFGHAGGFAFVSRLCLITLFMKKVKCLPNNNQ